MSTTTVCSGSSTSARPRSKSELRLRRPRPATLAIPSSSRRPPVLHLCQSLPHSLEALDLSSSSPTHTFVSLRFILLSYLADLEHRIAQFESPDVQAWIARKKGELDSDAAAWAQTALEMLHRIRDDVCSHFPDVPHITDVAAVEAFIKSHLPDLPDLSTLHDMSAQMSAHLPDMPHIPDMNEVRSHLPDMPAMLDGVGSALDDARARFDDVALKFHDLDFERPLNFLPTLSAHLKNLHSHLSAMEFPSMELGPPTTAILSDLMDSLLSSDLMAEVVHTAEHVFEEGEDMLEKAAQEVAGAVKRSLEGMRLITYNDLPHPWKNNPFVTQGYRFIPIERWPLIIMSLFEFHNETLNIHTHFIPFLFWLLNLVVLSSGPTHNLDTPELLFMCFALLCLFFSTVWHTMAGCADHKSMELCARADYVGIGWLISASIGTIVYYGFRCHGQNIGNWYMGLCLLTGLAGNVFPFMQWFNMHEYRMYRIAFFVTMGFTAIGPMVSLSYLHSAKEMFQFIRPVMPSILSYLMGLVFYAAHFPERALPAGVRLYLDRIGCGSHAIWHCFIVLAVSQHRSAIHAMKAGINCAMH